MKNQTFSFNPKVFNQIYEKYEDAIESVNADWRRGTETAVNSLRKSQLEKFVQTALWASLIQEEGRFHSFNLNVVAPDTCLDPFRFDVPVPFDTRSVVKLSPAFSNQNDFLGVWPSEKGELEIWGFSNIKRSNRAELLCETVGPGEILISFKEIGIQHFFIFVTGVETRFVNRSKFLDWVVPGYIGTRNSLRLPLSALMVGVDYRTVATEMRRHQHGGTLLIVPSATASDWRSSIRQPIPQVGTGYGLVQRNLLARKAVMDSQDNFELHDKLRLSIRNPELDAAVTTAEKSLRVIANLTAMDGATVISKDFDILCFGAKIEAKSKPENVTMFTPFEGDDPSPTTLSRVGGTRHQSAVQFVYEQRDAMAIVVSQDGMISIMRWDVDSELVHVIRPAQFGLL